MQKLVKDMENISELGVDINSSWNFKNGDVVLVKYEENIEQSIINRLSCKLDALDIFYDYYGSNLDEFLGWLRNDITLEYIRIEVEDVLRQDPRINSFTCKVTRGLENDLCHIHLEIFFDDEQTFISNLVIKGDGTIGIR